MVRQERVQVSLVIVGLKTDIKPGDDNSGDGMCQCGPEAAKKPRPLPASAPEAAFLQISQQYKKEPIKVNLKEIYLFIFMCLVCVYMYAQVPGTMCGEGAYRNQEAESLLELGLHEDGCGPLNGCWKQNLSPLIRTASALKRLSHLSSPNSRGSKLFLNVAYLMK